MNILPVTASTLSESVLVEYVKEKYILNKNCICILFRTGINQTYLISEY